MIDVIDEMSFVREMVLMMEMEFHDGDGDSDGF